MMIFILIILFSIPFALNDAINEYDKNLPNWYRIQKPFWIKLFKSLHAVSRFILSLFWIFWWLIILGMNFGDKNNSSKS
jgi:hypothetical protein